MFSSRSGHPNPRCRYIDDLLQAVAFPLPSPQYPEVTGSTLQVAVRLAITSRYKPCDTAPIKKIEEEQTISGI